MNTNSVTTPSSFRARATSVSAASVQPCSRALPFTSNTFIKAPPLSLSEICFIIITIHTGSDNRSSAFFKFFDGEAGKSSMYTMMQACRAADISYQTLKFYCNEGLVPNVKRDRNNRRIFDEHDVNLDQRSGLPKKMRHAHPGDERISGTVPARSAFDPPAKKKCWHRSGKPCWTPSGSWKNASAISTGSRTFTTKYSPAHVPYVSNLIPAENLMDS